MSIIFLKEFIGLNVNLDIDDRKCKTCGIKYKYCDCFLEHTSFKGDLIEYKCLYCNKKYQHKFDEKLKERFFKTYIFSNHNNNKFILLLRKGVYPYECMDDWEKLNEELWIKIRDLIRSIIG